MLRILPFGQNLDPFGFQEAEVKVEVEQDISKRIKVIQYIRVNNNGNGYGHTVEEQKK